MAKYTPPEQSKGGQFADIVVLVVAIFLALWLPLKMGLAGAAKEITRIDAPTWVTLKQTAGQAAQWEKLGYTPEKAHDIIQNKFNYTIDWLQLAIMAALLIGYFVFLFKTSDQEYRQVIDEKFSGK